jgi:hypothetical protein
MTASTLGKIAAVCSIVIIVGWGIYWGVQVKDTMCMIEASTAEDMPECLEDL